MAPKTRARVGTGGWALAVMLVSAASGCGGDGDPRTSVHGVVTDGGADAVGPAVPRDVDAHLVINELMAANVLTARDDRGAAGPWLEIWNPTDRDVPLGRYALTDDFATPHAGVIGDGAVVPARGHLVVWMDGDPDAGPTHVAARLNRDGGQVGLARPDGSFIDRLTYGAQEVDLSAAREPDGAPTWAIEWHASPGATNPGAASADGGEATDPETVPAAGDQSTHILGYGQFPQFSLTVDAAGMQALRDSPRTYVPATLSFEGRDYGPVGVHLKGMQSFEPVDQKPSLHINVDSFVPGAAFFGLKDLTLNNMHSDLSMMHERLAYWVARHAGVPASRCNHAWLTFNGQPYGLYANVETVKKRILGRVFASDAGSLFEATDVDFKPELVAAYALVAGPDDRTLLSGAAGALADPDPNAAMAAAAAFANVDQFTRYWAMCAVVGQYDSFPFSDPGDDYFTYADPVTGRLEFLPWGIDESFYSPDLDFTKIVHSVLGLRCLASPACYRKLVDNVWDILDLVENLDWEGERSRVQDQIASFVQADTRKQQTADDITTYQNSMRYFINNRRRLLSTMIPPPSGAAPTGIMLVPTPGD